MGKHGGGEGGGKHGEVGKHGGGGGSMGGVGEAHQGREEVNTGQGMLTDVRSIRCERFHLLRWEI